MHDDLNSNIIKQLRDSLPESEKKLLSIREKLKSKYIETDWDHDLRRKFDALLRAVLTRRVENGQATDNCRFEGRSLLVTGEAGTGKSETIKRLFRTHPSLQKREGQRSILLSVSLKAPVNLRTVGMSVLRGLDYPLSRDLKENIIWDMIQERLPYSGVLLIHFDEMHNLTDTANVLQLDSIRKTLKALMVSDTWPVGLIISGLPELIPEMSKIDEIRRRGHFVRVPTLIMPDDLPMMESVIGGLANTVDIQISGDDAREIAPRLIHSALNRFGIAIELTHEAIEQALVEEKPLNMGHFAIAFADRTGCGAPMNPFVAPNWAELDCSLVLMDAPPIEPVLPIDPPRRGRRGRAKGGRS